MNTSEYYFLYSKIVIFNFQRDNSTFISCSCIWITEDKRHTTMCVDIDIPSQKYLFTMRECRNIDIHIYICVCFININMCTCTHTPTHTPEGHRKMYYIYISIIVFVIIKINNMLICDFTPFFCKHFETQT